MDEVKSSKQLVVYTALFGDYDELKDPKEDFDSCYFVCFTDQEHIKSDVWEVRLVDNSVSPPKILNREHKMFPNKLFPDFEFSLYVDANIRIVKNPALNLFSLNDADLMIYEHQFRSNIYEEAKTCSKLGYDWFFNFSRQLKKYSLEGFEVKNNNLYECNVIYRRHGSDILNTAMESWWCEYCDGVKRDQLSFPYIVWKSGLIVKSLGITDIRSGQSFFELSEGHKKDRTVNQKIIGKINQFFEACNFD